jgi:hypothetical protein
MLLVDTNQDTIAAGACFETNDAYEITAHSLLLFVLQSAVA